MLKHLFPRQENFFRRFQEIADLLESATNHYQQMLHDFSEKIVHAQAIDEDKQKAVQLIRGTFELLHSTFITPFDRHDIHQLISEFGATFELINRTAQRISIYKLTAIPTEMRSLGALCACSATMIKAAISQVDSLKNSAQILKICGEINLIENEADTIALTGVANLFATTTDFKHLLIIKELYDHSENIINKFQVLAKVIECIVLEYS